MTSKAYTPDEVIPVIQKAFEEVAPLILEKAGKIEFSDKTDGSPVTEIDIEVEKIVINKINQIFPDLIILGEESNYDEDELPDYCWIIDPIDGTKSFIKGEPTFTCMALCVENNQAVACVIYNPSTGDCFTAIKGEGAYKNTERLDLNVLNLPKIAYCKGRDVEYINSIIEPAGVACEIAPEGAGFGFLMVASGVSASRFCINSKGYIHDYATGVLLVQEAGGFVIAINDDLVTLRTKSLVACHPGLKETITKNIQILKKLETTKS